MALVDETAAGTRAAVTDQPRRWRPGRGTWNLAVVGGCVALFALLAWNSRWIADDGLIVLRTVRHLLEGHGPVFNVGERVEVNTSPLWTYLLALVGMSGLRLEWLSLAVGGLCAVAGLGLALDGTRRLHGTTVVLAPAGVLAVLAMSPFREFATSGLETGLAFCWLGAVWWLLVRLARDDGGRHWPTALVIGLGPLVRPEFALFTAAGFVALLVVTRARRGPALRLALVAGALPVAYQVFRMGYYGLLTPNTALAKEASTPRIDRGWRYLTDTVDTYLLLVPLLALAVALVVTVRRRTVAGLGVAVLAPVLVLTLYVVWIGGDFMHARMLLPAIFCLLLPVLVLPATPRALLPLGVVGAWTVAAGWWLHVPYSPQEPAGIGISDERAFWAYSTRQEHPVLAEHFAEVPMMSAPLDTLHAQDGPVIVAHGETGWQAHPTTLSHSTVVTCCIGAVGMLTDSDVRVHDSLALANPLASHAEPRPQGMAGHDKHLPPAWDLADAGTPGAGLADARAALACPEVRDVLASVREPMSLERFWDNLTGAFHRTGLRYDPDPAVAKTCGAAVG
ncbi:hypothetical protein SaccyDRAFT_2310 [Saccharomonospora cyanea NA-134]|uniref:Terminal beta-(1->2)-arabinofuranosyltransferase C-terminal domain-containing protein n=1 Tax=Saccharomonospora cyanea NA-134 TaxID=882082 RepID=H5XQU7_9PSEU|nr:hypothetical protein SaccyDRAFT_2310 [Saccharomonospora cyanea NA-134]